MNLPARPHTPTIIRPLPRHRLTAIAILTLFVSACSSVPLDYPRQPSAAIPSSPETRLGEVSENWQLSYGEKSGFLGLTDGMDALGARLKLIEEAQVSIDAQYFLIKPDTAAGLFIGKLLRAADRGVRVRLLIDDIFTPNLDSELSLFASHPNVEVRLFNPVSRRGWKYWNYLMDFKRANRRMHNKSLTVDNSFTIVGGRNIADEYFQIKKDELFLDVDMLGIGPVAEEVAQTFDLFWNSSLALPIEAFDSPRDPFELNRWRRDMEAEIAGADAGIYAQAVNSQLLQEIAEGKATALAARALVVTDDPQKLKHKAGKEEYQQVAEELGNRMFNAQREIIIITPYFVPRQSGIEFMRQLRDRDVRVRVITNSLASTNHVSVHSGYAKYRKAMLEMGVELYEVIPLSDEETGDEKGKPRKRTLHTKLAIVDDEMLFLGSLNFDPRSIDINTEMGIFVESATIATAAEEMFTQHLARWTYKLILSGNDSIKWVDRSGGEMKILKKEPLSPWGRRFSSGFYGILPIENQL